MAMHETTIFKLAEWIHSQPDDDAALVSELHPFVVHVTIDAVTSSAVGHGELGSKVVELSRFRLYGPGGYPIWFTGKTISLAGAVTCNSRKSSILDLDDGHRKISGHIGAAVVVAVLTLAESINAPWRRIWLSIAIGYNIAIVSGTFANLVDDRTLASGRSCGVAVAGALGFLEKHSVEQIAQAIAIAAHTTNGRLFPTGTKYPHHTKEGIPEATLSGLNAHADAHFGGVGPLDIMDLLPATEDFDMNALLNSWHIMTVYFKIYGCCRWIHALLDAILELRQKISNLDSIDHILLETFGRTLTLRNLLEPQSIEDLQFSTQFCAALALVYGLDGFPRISPETLKDEQVLAWAKKMELKEDPELTKLFPDQVPGRVTITFEDASPPLCVEVLDPKGEPANPLSWEDREQKLFSLAPPKIGQKLTAKLYGAFLSMRDDCEMAPLFSCLRRSAAS